MSTFIMYTARRFSEKGITGGHRRFQEIIKHFLKNGHHVHLIAPKDVNVYRNKNLTIHPIIQKKSKYIPNGLLNFIYNYKSFKLIKKIKYNKVILLGIPYGIQFTLLKFRNVVLFIREDFIGYRSIMYGSAHTRFDKNILKTIYLNLLTLIERSVLRNVKKIVVQCEYDKDVILKRHNKIKNNILPKIVKISNNVNPSWIIKYGNDIKKKPIFKKPFDYYNLIFIGNVDDKRKGLHLFLYACKKLLENNYRVKAKVLGGGKLLDRYRRRNEFHNNIRFLGYHYSPMDELKKSDLLIVPSLADSFPNTIMEALFLEIPVIGAKRGGIPEMLKYEELLFEANKESLYKKLVNIFEESSLERLRQLSISRKKHFTFNWAKKISEIM